MSSPKGTDAAAPAAPWPADTYATADSAPFFNGETLQLIHVPDPHTDVETR